MDSQYFNFKRLLDSPQVVRDKAEKVPPVQGGTMLLRCGHVVSPDTLNEWYPDGDNRFSNYRDVIAVYIQNIS